MGVRVDAEALCRKTVSEAELAEGEDERQRERDAREVRGDAAERHQRGAEDTRGRPPRMTAYAKQEAEEPAEDRRHQADLDARQERRWR